MVSNASMIALEADPDDPEDFDVTEEAVEQALAERRERRRIGRPVGSITSRKRQIALRIDGSVIDRFKADGPGWQTRMNAALRKAVGL